MTTFKYGIIAAALAAAVAAAPASALTFANASPIPIADNSETTSDITIAGTTGTITGLSLTLSGLSHTYPDDLVMGLLNEAAGIGFVFLSGVGGSTDINNVTLTFSDAATGFLPESFFDLFPVTSGTYLPSNFGGYEFTAYDNAGSFSGFNGLTANGTWTLLIADVFAADVGSVAGGWSLDVTTSAVGGVPEPAAWAMLTIGFGLAGGAMRRRRQGLPTAA